MIIILVKMKSLILVCAAFLTKVVYIETTGNAGPVGEIKIYYVNECEPPVEDEMSLETYLETVDNDEKAFNFKLNIPFDIDDSYEFVLIADKWVDGTWQKETYKSDGNLFEFIQDYIPKIWENLRNICEPQIPEENLISAGEYVLKNFQEIAENVEFPKILYGRFMVTLYLTKDDKELACRVMEAESIASE